MTVRAARTVSTREVPFFAKVLNAVDVRVSGDFTGWGRDGIRLWDDGAGSWRNVLSLKPGVYQYRLVINGDWADHVEAGARVTNPFGGENCVLTVR